MTDATPEQLALARKISADSGFAGWVRSIAESAALAAIIETTERAASYIDKHYVSGDRDTHYEECAVRDLRNQEHLKDD